MPDASVDNSHGRLGVTYICVPYNRNIQIAEYSFELKEIVFIPSDCEERVKASLELLPEEVKELLLDRIVGRMSLEEVADKYGITREKVRQR